MVNSYVLVTIVLCYSCLALSTSMPYYGGGDYSPPPRQNCWIYEDNAPVLNCTCASVKEELLAWNKKNNLMELAPMTCTPDNTFNPLQISSGIGWRSIYCVDKFGKTVGSPAGDVCNPGANPCSNLNPSTMTNPS